MKSWILLLLPSVALAQRDLGRVLPANQPLHIVAFGDFGTGSRDQKDVAAAIARRHADHPFSFGVTMGDNFYRCGVRSVTDPLWKTRWEDLYTPLGFPFYAALGNHDYGNPPIICPLHRGSAEAEIAYTERSRSWRMPAHYYTYAAGPVRFIAIDTEGWSRQQLEWIKQTLAATAGEPGVRWRVVYGHHPIFTSGVHLNQRRIGALRRELLPVLRKAGVDLYVAGHDHDMERLKEGGMDFLIAGGGGAKLRAIRNKERISEFSATTHGFLELDITADQLTAQFRDSRLNALDASPLKRTK